MRDFPDIRFSHFADAAFTRACGILVTAKRHGSPKRPFNLDLIGQIQILLQLRNAGTNETLIMPTDAISALGFQRLLIIKIESNCDFAKPNIVGLRCFGWLDDLLPARTILLRVVTTL
ncbi:hypothetical protein BCF46_1746 [Litoreibacter meonggei]|uniref:Uncharacterized protein n=1 Tax=Litoreibacter meonggei TaxID=1049199 RepID=A0A497WR77_9RHOB|nr:hypothetical protein BCF46_1746 [Litoreibacter meonggei]